MSGKISDLNEHLFAQLERLKGDLTPEQVETEVARTGAIVSIAGQVTHGAELQIRAAKLFGQYGAAVADHLPRIGRAIEK